MAVDNYITGQMNSHMNGPQITLFRSRYMRHTPFIKTYLYAKCEKQGNKLTYNIGDLDCDIIRSFFLKMKNPYEQVVEKICLYNGENLINEIDYDWILLTNSSEYFKNNMDSDVVYLKFSMFDCNTVIQALPVTNSKLIVFMKEDWDVELGVEGIILDKMEKKRTLQITSKFLIQQLKWESFTLCDSINIQLKFPTSSIFFVCKFLGEFNNFVKSAKFQFIDKGHNDLVIGPEDKNFFINYQPQQFHHNNLYQYHFSISRNSGFVAKGINDVDEFNGLQPTGHLNPTSFTSNELTMEFDNKLIKECSNKLKIRGTHLYKLNNDILSRIVLYATELKVYSREYNIAVHENNYINLQFVVN
jgi:hypothetical protein